MVFYTDSKVVLGYICNESRRFYMYVANRVSRIRKLSEPAQWNYVSAEKNPADEATRCIAADKLHASRWLKGPDFFLNDKQEECIPACQFPLDVKSDKEVRPHADIRKTAFAPPPSKLGTNIFSRFSCWKKLAESIACLKVLVRKWKARKQTLQKSPD